MFAEDEILLLESESKNLRDSHQNTSTAAQGTHEIARDGQGTDAGTTERSRSRDDTLELTVHGLVTVTGHDQTLLLQLLGHVPWARAGNLDPGLTESGACDEHVGREDGGVKRVHKGVLEVERRAHVVD